MGRHEDTFAVPHKAGLVPHTVNLNKDSTHPKPWRPPTDWDHLMRIYDPYPIFTKTGPQFFKRKHNWIEDDPFMTNFLYFAKKGFGFGVLAAAIDHTQYSKMQGAKQQIMRATYVALPVMSMFVSYGCMREFSANIMERFGKKRDNNWTYVAAAMGPSSVIMAWHRLPFSTAWSLGLITATGGILNKEFNLMGRNWFFGSPGYGEESNKQWWFGPLDYDRANSRWSYYTNRDPGPTFDKFEDK